jgi:hypothetical protein
MTPRSRILCVIQSGWRATERLSQLALIGTMVLRTGGQLDCESPIESMTLRSF